ncbi:MAG: tripartite tricarboxylate transporter permease [Candidatus Aenigmatarchaeota archaeon]
MPLEILAFMFLGILFGIVTGLIPGLHPNTVFAIILSLSYLFLQFPLVYTLTFIISLAVTNVFIDFIPSIIFGAPDPDNCMSVLPGHQLLMEGRGYEAVFLSVTGGVAAVLITTLTLPVLLFTTPFLYSHIHKIIHILLSIVVMWMVWSEKNKTHALLIFILTGTLGLLSLNAYPSGLVLFPALTGLFGISGLVISFYGNQNLPEQKKTHKPKTEGIKGSITGWFAGMLAGILPGIGSSQAATIVSQIFKSKAKGFLTALGSINAANIIFTLIAFYTLGKTRSGATATISQLTPTLSINELILLMMVALTTTLVSAVITLKIAHRILSKLSSINYRKLNLFVILFLIASIIALTGVIGLVIAFTGTMIGILTIKTGVKRSNMMGFLVFPTILYFSGLLPLFSFVLKI